MAAKENKRGVVMGKLVRDKIPEIILNDGKTPIIDTLSNEEYLIELDKKLNEEVAEYQADKSIEEMADVLEVLFAICEGRGYTVEELMQVKEFKRKKRGAFKERIYWIGNEE
jgi:predicted house-cleaning noncanonical NTP pyrophosphatase (MazG superfamily)